MFITEPKATLYSESHLQSDMKVLEDYDSSKHRLCLRKDGSLAKRGKFSAFFLKLFSFITELSFKRAKIHTTLKALHNSERFKKVQTATKDAKAIVKNPLTREKTKAEFANQIKLNERVFKTLDSLLGTGKKVLIGYQAERGTAIIIPGTEVYLKGRIAEGSEI